MQWYERNDAFYQKRFIREVEFIENHNKHNRLKMNFGCFLQDSKKFCVSFWVTSRFFVLIYPDDYPNSPIRIKEFDPSDELYEHHINGGDICYHHNQWSFNWGVKYLYQRTKEWLQKGRFDPANDYFIPDLSQNFVLPKIEPSIELNKWGFFEYFEINPDTFFVKKLLLVNSDKRLNNFNISSHSINFDIPECFRNMQIKGKRGLFLVNEEKFINSLSKKNILKKCLDTSLPMNKKGLDKLIGKKLLDFPIAILNITSDYKKTHGLIVNKDSNVYAPTINNLEDKENIIMNKLELNKIKSKRIALVGVGSIGSVLACQLIKSGVENITLIDRDKLEVSNLYRHELDLTDIGNNKAKAMKEKLQKINSNVNCTAIEGDVVSLTDELLKQDLIISSVDNEETRLFLDEKLIPKNKTIIHVNSFYDAVAGIIFISNKRSSSCYKCFSDYLTHELVNKRILPDFNNLIPKVETLACGNNSTPGSSTNIALIALYGAKIAIKFLLSGFEYNEKEEAYNLHIVANEPVEQNGIKYFENPPTSIKLISYSYEKCHICSLKKDILTLDEDLKYNSALGEVLK